MYLIQVGVTLLLLARAVIAIQKIDTKSTKKKKDHKWRIDSLHASVPIQQNFPIYFPIPVDIFFLHTKEFDFCTFKFIIISNIRWDFSI